MIILKASGQYGYFVPIIGDNYTTSPSLI